LKIGVVLAGLLRDVTKIEKDLRSGFRKSFDQQVDEALARVGR
jgi:hypothetical protein